MLEPYEQIARNAAARLAATLGSELPQMTEKALDMPDARGVPDQYLDSATAINLASLVVSIASLVWSMCQDRPQKTSKSNRDVIQRRITLKVGRPDGVSVSQRDRIIEVVIDEAMKMEIP
ncbi:MAG: hypothetical protein NTX17_07120 [Candidatus Eisenbacteria bacterium]|nr:hypothetical protein [Candidatus Eisenbacteria bacterium]